MPNWIALDLETSGVLPEFALQPWRMRQRKAWITTVAFSRRNKAGELVSDGMVYPSKAYLRAILERAVEKNMTVVTWNGVFDMSWLVAGGLGELVDRVRWLDGMQLWKHLENTPLHEDRSLKGPGGAIDTFCPERQGYQEDVDYHDRTPEGLAKLLAYNKQDTEATLVVAEKVWAELEKHGTTRTIKDPRANYSFDLNIRLAAAVTEARCLPMLARANVEGMRVDHEAAAALDKVLVDKATELGVKLAPHGVTETMVRSPKQLSALLFDEWKLPAVKDRSTDKDALGQLVIVDDRVADILAFREALSLRAKFVHNIRKSCEYNDDGLTRPQAKVFGTYTSRLTYGSKQSKVIENGARAGTTRQATRQLGFALHQMKRSKEYRSLILAPEGYELVEFDAAGQEFRWMAILSGDETMLGLCLPGEDPHSYMAAQIYGLEYRIVQAAAAVDEPEAKKQRQGGKFANFSLQFRTGPKTVRVKARTEHNLLLSDEEANHICQTYLLTYPGVPQYWRNQIEFGRKNKHAATMAGRQVRVSGNWVGPHQWAMESTMINFPVQGTGGDQKYLAMSVLKNHVAAFNARFAWDLHDGLYWYVPKDKAMKFAVEMREVLKNLPYEKAWGFSSPIPLPWDAKIGPSWGALKPVED